MRILAVDTTSAHGSLALVHEDELEAILGFQTARPQHAENLLPSLEHLLGKIGATLDAIDGFSVAVGPGSFSGLRIGIAAVEGLAYAIGRPVAGVSALDATAFRYRHRPGTILALLEAYRGEVYAAAYDADGEGVQPRGEPKCEPLEVFLQSVSPGPVLVAGSGVRNRREILKAYFGQDLTLAPRSLFLGEELAWLGAMKLARGQAAPLGGLDALYIRPSDAQIHQEEKAR